MKTNASLTWQLKKWQLFGKSRNIKPDRVLLFEVRAEKLIRKNDAPEADDAFSPVAVESGKSYALAARSVIKTAVVVNDADVSEIVEKHERGEFITVIALDRHGILPESSRA